MFSLFRFVPEPAVKMVHRSAAQDSELEELLTRLDIK